MENYDQKINEYQNKLNVIQNEKATINNELAVINNQIETNTTKIMELFGTTDENILKNKMDNLIQDIQKLEQEFQDLESGKVTTEVNTIEHQHEIKPSNQSTQSTPIIPTAPSIPQAPTIPTAPSIPQVPTIPQI